MKALSILFLFLSFNSYARVYTIWKGTHGNFGTSAIYSTTVRREVIFDQSAVYSTRDPSNQADINKLFGFADCSSHHHTNSARFGWRWYNNQLQIFAYNYVKKVRQWTHLGNVSLDKSYKISISISRDKYIFNFNGSSFQFPRGCSSTANARYFLSPYFGGDETAPHTIRIELNKY